MEQEKMLDFTGDEIFCGIDVHRKSWKVCVRSKSSVYKTFVQPPSAITLANYLNRNFPGASYQVAYEAGFCGFNYQRQFEQLGITCKVVHAADVPTSDKERTQKNDTIDCRKISKCLSEGSLRGIYVPGIQQQNDRQLLRNYKQFIRDQTMCKNRIKCWLYFQGIEYPKEMQSEEKHWTKRFLHYLKTLRVDDASAKKSIDLLLKSLENVRLQVLEALRALRTLAEKSHIKKQMDLLKSIPGIGQITALAFITEIGDINRFKTFDQLCCYVGLIPYMHQSDSKGYIGELTHRGHSVLRTSLIECSWRAIRDDPALTKAFADYCKRMKKYKAIIKISRKLLNRIRFVLKTQTPYQQCVVN